MRWVVTFGLASLLGCAASPSPDAAQADTAPVSEDAASFDAGRDAPFRDVGPLPDGHVWTTCADYVAAGGMGNGEPCDPATFGSCAGPDDGCANILECHPDFRVIGRLLIC